MTRRELEKYIAENYCVEGDFPWADTPQYEVFRHSVNKKWFALIMNIPKNRLGLEVQGDIDIVNVKCDPLMMGSFRTETGFFPAYHMNKSHWITIALDGSAEDEKIRLLLDISYNATAPKIRKKHNS